MKERKRVSFLLAFLFLLLPAVSYGQLITIQIAGYVTSVSDTYGHLEGNVNVGDTFTATYTYDSTAVDSDADTTKGDYGYNTSSTGISLTIGSLDFQTNTANVNFSIAVENNLLANADYYNVVSRNNLSLDNGTIVQYIYWQLYDSTGTALSSDALPITAPDLSGWTSQYFYITTDRDFTITAVITSATLIPEPATLFLMGLGLIAFRKHNNHSTR